MLGHNGRGNLVKIEQVISVAFVADKAKLQEIAIKENEKKILRVKGTVSSHNTVESKTKGGRPTTYIKGAITGTDLLTGNEVISGQLILPDSASGYICTKIDEAGEPLVIDLTISVVRAVKSITGYKLSADITEVRAKSEPEPEIIVEPERKKKQAS